MSTPRSYSIDKPLFKFAYTGIEILKYLITSFEATLYYQRYARVLFTDLRILAKDDKGIPLASWSLCSIVENTTAAIQSWY